jgi:hypothetical protein
MIWLAAPGMSHAKVKAGLEITDKTEEQWREETTDTTTKDYLAGHTYITWKLVDSLRLHKVKTITGTGWATHVVEDNTTTLNNPLKGGVYEDDAADTDKLPAMHLL